MRLALRLIAIAALVLLILDGALLVFDYGEADGSTTDIVLEIVDGLSYTFGTALSYAAGVLALVSAGQSRRWVWFAAMFLLTIPAVLVSGELGGYLSGVADSAISGGLNINILGGYSSDTGAGEGLTTLLVYLLAFFILPPALVALSALLYSIRMPMGRAKQGASGGDRPSSPQDAVATAETSSNANLADSRSAR